MSDKSLLPSRLLLCLITASMVLLIFSSLFLLQFSNHSFITRSVSKLIPVNNNASAYFKPSVRSQNNQPMRINEVPCQSSDPGKTSNACDINRALLRVYLYDLPPEFHFGLLGWKGNADQIWPDVTKSGHIPPYPGGLNLQHSMEYWLTVDLLSSTAPNIIRPCSAIRVYNSSQADIILVPFFSSLSYNRYSKVTGKEKVSINRMLQNKLVEFLKNRDEWKKLDGKDHLIVAHHPNSMLVARKKLGSAMFILADFGRYLARIANLEKDVIAPYKHLVKTVDDSKSAPFEGRPILVYFQGAIYRKDVSCIPNPECPLKFCTVVQITSYFYSLFAQYSSARTYCFMLCIWPVGIPII